MAKAFEVVLKKEGAKDITVKCPRSIKLNPVIAAISILYGMPPFQVKPINGKDVLIALAGFAMIFISLGICTVSLGLGFILFIAVLVFNFLFTKNYFFNFIKKRLAEGYTVEDSEQKQILQEAGISIESNGATAFSGSAQAQSSQEDVTAQIEKLAGLVEKGLLTKEEFAAQKAKLLGL